MIKKIDHIVITTNTIKECLAFYVSLGFASQSRGGRHELFSGDCKINVHIKGSELLPHALNVQVGSADLCFEISEDILTFKEAIEKKGIVLESGIVSRYGARGAMQSLYVRDPDGNLLEFSSYQ